LKEEMFPMKSKNMSFWALALALLISACVGKAQYNQKHERVSLLNSPVDEKTVVRLFYDPAGDYFHKPLVFRVVQEGNPLLNTAPIREEGRTAYISLLEMHDLVEKLVQADLAWQESERVAVLESYKKLPVSDEMEVLVAFSHGMARAQINPKTICRTLKPLDAALRTPRALWEFQGFRFNYKCKVPGFKPDAYPDHY
jgi:hypothetical protein